MTWPISRNELTDPSFVTLRHSSRHLHIWLISGWHWAHLSHHGNSVRPCFGAVPRPGLCWAGHFTIFAPSCPGMGLLAVLLPVLFPSRFITNATVPHSCRALHCLLPRSQSSLSLSPSPLLCLPARPAHRVDSPDQPACKRAGQSSNARTRWATRPPCPPIHSLSQPRPKPPIPRSALIQKASPTMDLLIGRITTPSCLSNCERPAIIGRSCPSLARASRQRVVGGAGRPRCTCLFML